MPFTIVLLVGLLITAFFTGAYRADLSAQWMQKIGFAPNDLWLGRIEQMILSAFFTDSPKSLIQALVMTAASVGRSETVLGTERCMLVFFGIHILTLVILSLLIIWPLHFLKHPSGTSLAFVKDVGPSAGYFGCLGNLVFMLPGRFRLITVISAMICLSVAFFIPAESNGKKWIKNHADLAHWIAFVLGVLYGRRVG